MAKSRRQAVIDAPVEDVWELVGDPSRYPDWAGGVLDVTGVAEVERGAEFQQEMRGIVYGSTTTTFRIDEVEELREIRLHCTASGLYSHWLLTEARESTFVDVEVGMDPTAPGPRAFDATVGKLWYRRLLDESIEGLRKAVTKVTQGRPGPG